MDARRCPNVQSYLERMDSEPLECHLLLRELTVKYSQFFRDPDVFTAIRNNILPELFARYCQEDCIGIWSAGCAKGEEAYSLAILVRQLQAQSTAHPCVDILATDIDPQAIDAVRVGNYRKMFLPDNMDAGALQYFRDDGKTITASVEITRLVTPMVHDLAGDYAAQQIRHVRPRGFDLILCRNTLIYFKPPLQARIAQVLCELLKPDGYLVLGTKEILPGFLAESMSLCDASNRIYRKTTGHKDEEDSGR